MTAHSSSVRVLDELDLLLSVWWPRTHPTPPPVRPACEECGSVEDMLIVGEEGAFCPAHTHLKGGMT